MVVNGKYSLMCSESAMIGYIQEGRDPIIYKISWIDIQFMGEKK